MAPAGGAFSHSARSAGSLRGATTEKWIPRSPMRCTRLSVLHPEYVVLSTAGSR